MLTGILVLLGVASPSAAHDFAMSSVDAVTRGDRVALSFRLDRTSVADLLARERPVAKPLSLADLEAGRSAVQRYLDARLRLTSDGQPCPLSAPALAFDDATGRVRLDVVARCGRPLARLELESTLFADESTPHELVLSFSHGGVAREFMFYHQQRVFELDASVRALPASPASPLPPPPIAEPMPFVAVGLRHILSGWDHVLFVLSLVLVASTLRRLAVVVTAFTLGHCLALALATLGWVTVPAALVEPLIAASILWVVMHDVVLRSAVGPTPAVFGFGLLHGLGFAEVLVELALPPDTLGWALLAFNVGVELGQLAIVAVAFGLLAPVRRRPSLQRRVQLGTGTVIATWALLWVVERVLDVQLVPG